MLPSYFRSALLSNWQSVVAKKARPPDPLSPRLERPLLDFSDERILAASEAAREVHRPGQGQNVGTTGKEVWRVAKAALNLGMALVHADVDEIIAAKAAFMRFGWHDPFWLECVIEFVEHYSLTQHSAVPYIKYRSLTDCILPPGVLPPRCRIAMLSDWGTGDPRAQALLEEVAGHKPDILIHLGDIYYACTALEANAFHGNITRAFAGNPPRLFTLCGNHDMYSGAAPYYALLKRIGQPASFFCLRNADWQFLAADTGYNDFDPRRYNQDATWIRDRDEGDVYSELDWHKDKLVNSGGRRTVLMTHHPLFTRNSTVAGRAANPRLLSQFGDYLPEISAWFWGHEHNIALYEPFLGLRRGRCLGASGVPVPATDDLTSPSPDLAGQDVPQLLAVKGQVPQLEIQADGDLYQLGYALIDLDGRDGRATYRQFDPILGVGSTLYEETLD